MAQIDNYTRTRNARAALRARFATEAEWAAYMHALARKANEARRRNTEKRRQALAQVDEQIANLLAQGADALDLVSLLAQKSALQGGPVRLTN